MWTHPLIYVQHAQKIVWCVAMTMEIAYNVIQVSILNVIFLLSFFFSKKIGYFVNSTT